jgi:hypothetical protein
MKYSNLSSKLLFILALILAISCHDPAGLGGLASINGRVFIKDDISDAPFTGIVKKVKVEIFFEHLKNVPDVVVYTNSTGEYSLLGLTKGTYLLRCNAQRYALADTLLFLSQALRVEIPENNAEITGQDLTLDYAASTDLLIQIKDVNGDPLPMVSVYLFNNQTFAQSALLDTTDFYGNLRELKTRQNGSVFIKGITPGKYHGVVNLQAPNPLLNGIEMVTIGNDPIIYPLNIIVN